VTDGDLPVKGEELRFRIPGDPRLWHLEVERVELPFVEGLAWAEALARRRAPGVAASGGSTGAEPPALRRLDLRSLELVEIETPGRGLALSTGAALVVAAAAYAALLLIVMSSLNFGSRAAPTP